MNIKKDLIQTIKITAIALVLTLGINYIFAWTGPTLGPPEGNTSAPINVGTVDQVKSAGLGVNALSVFGNGYVSGNFGIGTISPFAKLDVDGGIKFGNDTDACDSTKEGTTRYDSIDKELELCDGINWVSVGSGAGAGITWLEEPVQILTDSTLSSSVYETLTISQVPANSVVILNAHVRGSLYRDEIYLYLREKGSSYVGRAIGLNFLTNIAPDHIYIQAMVKVDENKQMEYSTGDSPLLLELDLLGYIY